MRHVTIEADNDTLFRQASKTAAHYLGEAMREIDDAFGSGHAKAHPELVAAFMQTCAADLGAAVIARAIEGVSETINAGILEAMQSRD